MPTFRTLERYEDSSLGLPYPVVLVNGAEEEIDDNTGERIGVSIPHLEDLVATIAVARVLNPSQLDGAEVRFIRRVIGRTAKEFANNLGIAPETYSRWENGRQTVGAWADKQVRLAVILLLLDKVGRAHVDPAQVVNMQIHPRSPNDVPQMEIRLVHHADQDADHHQHEFSRDTDEWELKLAA